MAAVVKLVRHALHSYPADALCGRLPGVSLSARGVAQLAALVRLVGAHDAIYSSPQLRCRQTAAALGARVTIEPALDEIDFGAWTGLTFAELDGRDDWRAWNTNRDAGQAPGGESAAAVRDRAVTFAERIRRLHDGQSVVLVSHGDVIKSIVTHYLGLKLQACHAFEVTQASVSTLALGRHGAVLTSLNGGLKPALKDDAE